MYQYGNVAVQYQKEKLNRPQIRKKQHILQQARPQEQALVKSRFSAGEKFLYILCIILMVTIASLLLSNYAAISQMNYEIQYLEKELTTINEQNINLQLEVSELSAPERIIKKATEEYGMTKSSATVKIMSANSQDETANE